MVRVLVDSIVTLRAYGLAANFSPQSISSAEAKYFVCYSSRPRFSMFMHNFVFFYAPPLAPVKVRARLLVPRLRGLGQPILHCTVENDPDRSYAPGPGRAPPRECFASPAHPAPAPRAPRGPRRLRPGPRAGPGYFLSLLRYDIP